MTIAAHSVAIAVLGLTLGVAVAASPADAQPADPRTFGTASSVSHTVGATRFTSQSSTLDAYNTFGPSGQAARFCTAAGGCVLQADVLLPAGALATSIEVDGCDTSATDDLQVSFQRQPTHEGGGPPTNLAVVTSGPGNPGCVYFTAPLATPETIDNGNFNYLLRVVSTVANSSLRFQAVRIFYTLQVSPAPATATFGDVPTSHPFFQFIEALVGSGITAGCGGGNYCPDAPLTRGQMAVFLSKGLGLHFAP